MRGRLWRIGERGNYGPDVLYVRIKKRRRRKRREEKKREEKRDKKKREEEKRRKEKEEKLHLENSALSQVPCSQN